MSLNAFRGRCLHKMLINAQKKRGRSREKAMEKVVACEAKVKVNGAFKHPTAEAAASEVLCPVVPSVGLVHLNCALRRCSKCPSLCVPTEETGTDDDAPKISFHVHKKATQCSVHGALEVNAAP